TSLTEGISRHCASTATTSRDREIKRGFKNGKEHTYRLLAQYISGGQSEVGQGSATRRGVFISRSDSLETTPPVKLPQEVISEPK
ncbi:MAG: hypothetical protein II764_06065, partial [Bacteroidales bacterium]|nr:hypothetical protein [Bacteroidales bacterium]